MILNHNLRSVWWSLIWGAVAVCSGFALIAAVVGQTTARAQDGEATPTFEVPIIYGYRQETLFPVLVRFYLGTNSPIGDLVSVVLTVSQDSGLEETIPLDLQRNLVSSEGAVSDFEYDWELLAHSGLVPFQPVDYRWEVQTINGDIATAARSFDFLDSASGQWYTAGQPPLILHWQSSRLAGSRLWDELMAAYGLLNSDTERVPLFEFAIYEQGATFCEEATDDETGAVRQVVISDDGTEFPCSEDAYRKAYAAGGITMLQRQSFGFSEVQDMLVDSIVSQTYTLLWGDWTVPAWYLSGLSYMYHLHPGLSALEVVRAAARTDSLPLLADMQSPLPDDAPFDQRTLWESSSYLMVLYLADQYGADAPFALARDIRQESTGFDGALNGITDGDQQALWAAWKRWVFTEAASLAAGWMPYLPTTPTPTATATDTPLPPTRTATPTPTITHVPTSTFAGDRAPTVAVIGVSPTVHLTATNTPLPPGSLPTVVPTPVPSSSNSGDNNLLYNGALVALVVSIGALVVILLGVIVRRDR